ncbi:uncharacterized protein SOCEGT47_009050 [Sorangium cellulosum]|uniref:Amine oxidase domain-containing protein n=1 Tax=Sorangium cellulosum TaxID=56 RepID=A0A4P2PVG9_SORCE|nr:FAD-dependent oxidoreductase [Sorangium cellulosum]AUX20436.1 uncharacterized protein SOCEGT47_009050 [Sorangium cellulosum]
MGNSEKQRIGIVGAGAAGLAAAWSLGRSGRFDVSVYEAAAHVGGVATTRGVSLPGRDAVRVNDQVLLGTPSYRNTARFFEEFGFSLSPTRLRVAMGTGEARWSTARATPFIARMRPEIRRFRRTLELVRRAPMPLFLAIPIDAVLRAGRFSADFRHRVLYPLMSLFFASGVDSARVPAAVVAGLFLDEDSRLFDLDAETFLAPSTPITFFPDLAEVYARVAAALNARVHTDAEVLSVVRSAQGVRIERRGGAPEELDAILIACSAERALPLLADASPLERLALRGVTYQDVTLVTHTDADYIRHHYGDDPGNGTQYYVRNAPHDMTRLEISINLGSCQPWLPEGAELSVFQTFDPLDTIRADKVLFTRRTRHNRATPGYFLRVLPLLRRIQGRRRTSFAGAYLMFNNHENAIVSGLAAADHLGAPYPFSEEPAARLQFERYRRAVYG